METWHLILAPFISGLLGAIPVLVLLKYRMDQVERHNNKLDEGQERLSTKIDEIGAPFRLGSLENEMERTRQRLHRIEGNPSGAAVAADLMELKTDMKADLTGIRIDLRAVESKIDGFIREYRQKG